MHPDDAEREPWRPEDVAALLAGIDVPWAVAAGWAIDLFIGTERREHEDLELAVPAHRFADVAGRLSMVEFFVVMPGTAAPVEREPERLADGHQTWGLDRRAKVWRVDVFREPSLDGRWVCRRDAPITRQRALGRRTSRTSRPCCRGSASSVASCWPDGSSWCIRATSGSRTGCAAAWADLVPSGIRE